MKIHIVKRGETLGKIAKKYNISLEKLKEVNAHIKDEEKMVAGAKVKIPTLGVPLKAREAMPVSSRNEPAPNQTTPEYYNQTVQPKLEITAPEEEFTGEQPIGTGTAGTQSYGTPNPLAGQGMYPGMMPPPPPAGTYQPSIMFPGMMPQMAQPQMAPGMTPGGMPQMPQMMPQIAQPGMMPQGMAQPGMLFPEMMPQGMSQPSMMYPGMMPQGMGYPSTGAMEYAPPATPPSSCKSCGSSPTTAPDAGFSTYGMDPMMLGGMPFGMGGMPLYPQHEMHPGFFTVPHYPTPYHEQLYYSQATDANNGHSEYLPPSPGMVSPYMMGPAMQPYMMPPMYYPHMFGPNSWECKEEESSSSSSC